MALIGSRERRLFVILRESFSKEDGEELSKGKAMAENESLSQIR